MLKFKEFDLEVLFNEEFTNSKDTKGDIETCQIWIMRCQIETQERDPEKSIDFNLEETRSERNAVKTIKGFLK